MKIESIGNRPALFAFACLAVILFFFPSCSKRELKIVEILSDSDQRNKIESIFKQSFANDPKYKNLTARAMFGVDTSTHSEKLEKIIHSKIYDIFVYADESGVNAVKVRASNNSSFIWMADSNHNIYDYMNSLDKIRSTHGKFTSLYTERD